MRPRNTLVLAPLLTLAGNAAIAAVLWLAFAPSTPPEPTRQALSIGRIRHHEPPRREGSVTGLALAEARRTSATAQTLPDPEAESEREPTAEEVWFQLTGHRHGERDGIPNAMATSQGSL